MDLIGWRGPAGAVDPPASLVSVPVPITGSDGDAYYQNHGSD
jgi:hypothetical protein